MAKAWMIIGTASRLETLRSSRQDFGEGLNSDVNSHCYWSVFISERAFFPQQTGLLSMGNLADYPKSAPLPPSVDLAGDINYHPDLTSSNEQIKNLGINSYYIQMVSFWGEITSYLNDVRHGKAEVPWLPDSTHIKLNMKLHEFEAQLPEQHLVRGVFRTRRSSIEVHQQKEYWLPWFTMQVISHSSAAIVNHPFIHLAAVRERQGISQSRLFLQQTVDQALYHSGWVFRLLGICEDLELQIVNPLIGQLVAANATIQWIFQYAHDEKVSKSASAHLAVCARLLERIANVWPSIAEKVLPSGLESEHRGFPNILTDS